MAPSDAWLSVLTARLWLFWLAPGQLPNRCCVALSSTACAACIMMTHDAVNPARVVSIHATAGVGCTGPIVDYAQCCWIALVYHAQTQNRLMLSLAPRMLSLTPGMLSLPPVMLSLPPHDAVSAPNHTGSASLVQCLPHLGSNLSVMSSVLCEVSHCTWSNTW